MANGMGGRVGFVVENYGDSELARRFGVTRYPAIFVDDILVATPKDFGFYGKGEGGGEGRYTPWRDARSHERFRSDLTRMLERVLAGERDAVRSAVAARAGDSPGEASFPDLALTGLDGRPIAREALAGRPVLVEFWATWCLPCRGTLAWLGELRERYGDRVEVVAVAIESDEDDVRARAVELGRPLRFAIGSPEVARAFGDLSAVPTLFLYDREGRQRDVFYGAPPDLHERAERALRRLLDDSPVRDLEDAGPGALAPGRYRRADFVPRLTFEVGEGWHAVQAVDGFFDVQRDPGSPDVVAVQFARPTGARTAEEALAALRGRDGIAVGDTRPVEVGGAAGAQVVVDAADPDLANERFVEVLRVAPGPISIASGRRLQVTFVDTADGLLAVLVGGSVRRWDDAVAAAGPVLASIELGDPYCHGDRGIPTLCEPRWAG